MDPADRSLDRGCTAWLRPAFFSLLLLPLLAACGTLPKAGPTVGEIRREKDAVLPFRLVDITANTIVELRQRPTDSFAANLGEETSEPQESLIGIGDGVTVTLWEAGGSPLLSSGTSAGGGSRSATLPEQSVGQDGALMIPYSGRIAAAGKTTTELQAAIEKALAGKTQSPQVLVTVTRPGSNAVTLMGEAVGGARVPLSVRGERVLDVIAAVGGSRSPIHETRVQLTRADRHLSLPLGRLLSDPAENVRLKPGDTLVVTRAPQRFSVFGAAAVNGQLDFGAENLNLVDAVARAGGLLDQRADPAGVFVFRSEAAPEGAIDTKPVPVIYRLDLTRAGSYFLGRDFEMRDRDIVYVAGATTNELQKFLVLLGLVSQPVINGVIVNQATK